MGIKNISDKIRVSKDRIFYNINMEELKMKDLTLVIMAAGMGSRFGGLKQIEPVGPNDEFIIDYSIYDAKKAGFNKVVFIIKKENYEIFKETIGKRVEDKIEVKYAFQELDMLPDGYSLPENRIKPWGTAHAILCCKDLVNGCFAVINSDDFYGQESYKVLADFLNNKASDNHFAMVGYKASNTLTANGSVKRGICEEENNYLTKITESKVEKINNEIICTPLDGRPSFKVPYYETVSMNMFGFTSSIFDYLEKDFPKFLDENISNLTSEYLIPDVIFDMIKKELIKMEVLKTDAKWYGVTYKEDKEEVVNAINEMVRTKKYNKNLWG